jgi:hypothetical protein
MALATGRDILQCLGALGSAADNCDRKRRIATSKPSTFGAVTAGQKRRTRSSIPKELTFK